MKTRLDLINHGLLEWRICITRRTGQNGLEISRDQGTTLTSR